MPMAAPRICGCGHIVPSGALCECQIKRNNERKRRFDAKRPSARERGYDVRWTKESKAFLAQPQNRFCACGCGRVADMVDHIRPHRGDRKLFWDKLNWQAMASVPCHVSHKQRIECGSGHP